MTPVFSSLHISIAADELFHIGPLPVTNAMVLGGMGVAVLLAVFFYAAAKLRRGEKNFLVSLVQWAFEGMYGTCEDIVGDKKMARSIAPLALTIFFVVLATYWISIIPGVGESLTWHGKPLLRGLPADLNFTFGLAIVTMVAVQIYAIKQHGFFGNAGRYLINPLKNPIGAFEGILELVGEFSRLVALSLRLFGNAFAGEVLLMIIAVLTSYFATVTLPFFMAFELFIGFIQAYVFFVLTLIFAALATAGHGSHDTDEKKTIQDPVHSPTVRSSQAGHAE
jgi:F-type H+-transporting ATPase subunit a